MVRSDFFGGGVGGRILFIVLFFDGEFIVTFLRVVWSKGLEVVL